MRLCASLPLSLCLAAAAVLGPVPSADARAGADPSCGGGDDPVFPVTTRIHGGPASYEIGGGFGTWYIDLTNTTRTTCADVHPVIVLVDDKRALKPSQPQLEFYDGTRALPVHFESTDEKELVGVFDGSGFAGFSVAPGKTVTVKVRLSLTSDAVSNMVTANAAVVQRHDKDGDWIGQSNDYRFGIGDGADSVPLPTDEPEATVTASVTAVGSTSASPSPSGSASSDAGLPSAGETGETGSADDTGEAVEAGRAGEAGEGGEGGEAGEAEGGRGGGGARGDHEDLASGPRAHELAATGSGVAPGVLAAVVALAAVGGGVRLLARGRR
ncbi:hypothetical protein ACIPSA_05760 [Streptomyces sp. NPDC086549]|uniref:hypothetical protein n=1 Tax=Streptomyces sp. NPDC086549 TaxID=3365752 RepID=UPI003810001B